MTISEHPFAEFIRQIGKGQKGRKDLSEEQAFSAMMAILHNEVTETQIGAFLMLMRVKEECEDELIGFVRAIEAHSAPALSALNAEIDISWSSYSGKRDESNWYILAQLALSQSYRILVHGGPGHTPGRHYTETIYRELGLLPTRTSRLDNPLYLPLRDWAPKLEQLLALRFELGLRSPLNSVLRLCSPIAAKLQVMSVFHPRYSPLHQKASIRLGRASSLVFKGAGGEAEIRPTANTQLFFSQGNEAFEFTMNRQSKTRLAPTIPSTKALRDLWCNGALNSPEAQIGELTILETMTAVLMAYHHTDYQHAREESAQLWHDRDKNRLDIEV